MTGNRLHSKPNNSIRVCTLIDAWEPIWGGGQTHTWELCIRLVQRYKYTIDIFTRSLIDEKNRAYITNNTYFGHSLRVLRIGPAMSFFSFIGRISWLFSVVFAVVREHLKNPYKFIHAHAYTAAVPAKILNIFLKIPVIFTVHGSNNLDLRKGSLFGIIENLLLTKVYYDRQISVSHSFLRYPNINKNIAVIPNGVDIQEFETMKVKKRTKRPFTILWVGRFDKVKGVSVLLHAFAQFATLHPNSRLFLVGYGYEQEALQHEARQLGIEGKVKFWGKRKGKSLIAIYKAVDLFVLPSLSEGQSVTLLEAWAAQLPVIATRVGDNSVIIEEGKDGFLVVPGDSNGLYEAIECMYTSKKRVKMGKHGYQKVKKHYFWDNAAQKLVKVYENFSQ